MRIGETWKVETDVPRPITVTPFKVPVRVPEKVPVGVPERREPERKGIYVQELYYNCPHCGGTLEVVEGQNGEMLVCPQHGAVQEI